MVELYFFSLITRTVSILGEVCQIDTLRKKKVLIWSPNKFKYINQVHFR